jgi:hypothetical protein
MSIALARSTIAFTRTNRPVEHLQGMGGLHHVACEASSEAETSGMRRTVVGGCRVVVVAGERLTRGNRRAGSARNHSR